MFANYLLEKSSSSPGNKSFAALRDVGEEASESEDDEREEQDAGTTAVGQFRRTTSSLRHDMKPFKEWLKDRREISHILSRKTLD